MILFGKEMNWDRIPVTNWRSQSWIIPEKFNLGSPSYQIHFSVTCTQWESKKVEGLSVLCPCSWQQAINSKLFLLEIVKEIVNELWLVPSSKQRNEERVLTPCWNHNRSNIRVMSEWARRRKRTRKYVSFLS